MEKKKNLRVSTEKKQRIDIYIKEHTSLSRSQVKNLIEKKHVFLNDEIVDSTNQSVKENDLIEYIEELPRDYKIKQENIPLEVLFEDENILLINKQPGLVVHPAPGHYEGTLVNALVGKYIKEESYLGGGARLGIVHRLDKDTSGVMVVAKNNSAHEKLVAIFKAKAIKKTYFALVNGVVEEEGMVDTYISRDVRDRKKFSAKTGRGKEAQTIYVPEKIFHTSTLLRVNILTGRTHQIRVHMNYIKHDIVGDPVYGNKGRDNQLLEYMGFGPASYKDVMPRQMLHAGILEFVHPFTEKNVRFEAPMPADMSRIVNILEEKAK